MGRLVLHGIETHVEPIKFGSCPACKEAVKFSFTWVVGEKHAWMFGNAECVKCNLLLKQIPVPADVSEMPFVVACQIMTKHLYEQLVQMHDKIITRQLQGKPEA